MDIIRELILKIIYILIAGLTVTGPADTPEEPVKDLQILQSLMVVMDIFTSQMLTYQ